MNSIVFKVPFGLFIKVAEYRERIREIKILRQLGPKERLLLNEKPISPLLGRAKKELIEYFKGTRKQFTVPVDFTVLSEFQKRVLEEVMKIPYGETRSYEEIAKRIGKPGASRAIGQALKRNPFPILIPCHRVTYSNKGIGGFLVGADVKEILLVLERANR